MFELSRNLSLKLVELGLKLRRFGRFRLKTRELSCVPFRDNLFSLGGLGSFKNSSQKIH